jgi:cytochrome P450
MGILSYFGRAILLLSIFAITSSLLYILYNIFLHPLSRYPGPWTWAATRLRFVLGLQRGYFHQDLLSLHNKYGPIVRIAPDELSYIDPQAWKDIYVNGGARPGKPAIERNGVWFRPRSKGEPKSIMGNNEDAHARYRRAFAGAFSEKSVREQSGILEGYVALMMGKFRDMIASGGEEGATLDIVQWLNSLTFDISGDLSFGESFGGIESGVPHPWVEIACRFGKGLALVASINYYAFLAKGLIFNMPEGIRQKMVYHVGLSQQKVQSRLALKEERNDFIQSVLKYNSEKKEQVTPKELELNMAVFVFAGSETSSTALASVMFGLLRTPLAMKRAVEEVRSTFSSEDEIDVASTSKLEYITAVINEGMRMGPPSAVTVPRVTVGPEEICGQFVPPGVSRAQLYFLGPC